MQRTLVQVGCKCKCNTAKVNTTVAVSPANSLQNVAFSFAIDSIFNFTDSKDEFYS